MMNFRLSSPRILVTTGLIAALATGIAVSITALAAPAPPTLTTVTTQTLAASGVTLGVPEVPATVSRDAAIQVATAALPGSQSREVVLAQVHNDHLAPVLDRLAWVVSIMPPGGIYSSSARPGGQALQGSYLLVFVDAQTGAFIYATRGGEIH